ncbi:MAG: RNA 3'-terminal phosphate cyclase [Armatimonadota bacterium]|jgi:RNA 3'-terminal phosphate cyclase (ATP)
MITIDGSHGEGGGQVLRTSLSLAALLGRELRLRNIRAGRSKPGLAAQHLTGVRAAAAVCGASVDGDRIGSQQLEFRPEEIRAGRWQFEVGTAGSASLVLQTVLPALLFARGSSHIQVHGGTNVPWSPPQEYIDAVFLPTIGAMGAEVAFECLVPGFYPRGGGCIEARVRPLERPLSALRWTERGELRSLTAYSVAEARLPGHIIRRQIDGAREVLGSTGLRAVEAHPPSRSPGTMLTIAAGFERGRAGFSAIGRRGKPAEQVGREAGREAASLLGGSASVDRHLADQLLLYAAVAAGRTQYVTDEVTEHLRTNAWVIRQFIDVEISIDEATGVVTVDGAGMPATGGRRGM